ncbi:MAG: Crp/Fnr family transcriptional regulator [Acidobacteria bacterium]|nr:Crp/Fnr family transcriptional regulator [Acidobacteriota bacterium]
MSAHKGPVNPPKPPPFDFEAFLDTGGVAKNVVKYRRGEAIYSRGEPCDRVFYIQSGGAKISVLSHAGKESIVTTLAPGAFFGEAALAGQPVHLATAIATSASAVLVVEKAQMVRLLHSRYALLDRFLIYVLARNFRVEADLVKQVFTATERRLARALLFLARYGKQVVHPHRVLPKVSQEMLAEMVGTTRPRLNVLMKKFKKLGYIDDNGGLKINEAVLTIVLHD